MSFKKWLYKYKYLQFELEDVESRLQGYMTQFNNYFDLPKKDPSPPQLDSPPLQQKSEKLEKTPKNSKKKNKEFYKKLSKKTHPDKGGNKDDFKDINLLYQDDDILGMYLKAEELGIDLEELNIEDDEEIFEKSCKTLEEKAKQKQTTLAWLWGTCPPQNRDNLTKIFKEKYKIEPRKK